jgi:cullin 1
MAANNPTVYPMPPANADLATTWAFLEEGVDHIMTKLQTGVSYSKYMALYTVSYNYCTSSKMHGGGETLGHAGRSKSSQYRHPPHTPHFFSSPLLFDAVD